RKKILGKNESEEENEDFGEVIDQKIGKGIIDEETGVCYIPNEKKNWFQSNSIEPSCFFRGEGQSLGNVRFSKKMNEKLKFKNVDKKVEKEISNLEKKRRKRKFGKN
ncbi:hypothetical protein MHBO_002133, partial [Bonamia ostreae]